MLAFHAGYAAVRPVDRPLREPEFSRWWLALLRWREIQTEEGLKSLRARVAERKAIAAADAAVRDALREEQEEQNTADDASPSRRRRRAAQSKKVYDPASTADQSALFRDRARLLALLPADDPRAIYLRDGGSLDEQGNPLRRGAYVNRAKPPTPVTITDPTTGAALTQSVHTTATPKLVYPPGYGPTAQPQTAPAQSSESAAALDALLARDDLPAELRDALRATTNTLSSLDGLSGAPSLPNLPTL